MYEINQLAVPPSFAALYTGPNGKPTAARDHVTGRYELCEDLAQGMSTQCLGFENVTGLSQPEVLARCHKGLIETPDCVNAAEAEWVMRRAAELLEWDVPASAATS